MLHDEVRSGKAKVLPLLFRDCSVPSFLQDKKYADFRKDYEEGFSELLDRLSPPVNREVISKLLSQDKMQVLSAFERIPQGDRAAYADNLLQRLSSKTVSERGAVIYAFWATDHDFLPVAFLRGLRDTSNSVRQRTVFLMGETADSIYEKTTAGLMSDNNPGVRQAAREAYAKLTKRGRGAG